MLCAVSVWFGVKQSSFRVPAAPYKAGKAGGACSQAMKRAGLPSDMSSVEASRARRHPAPGRRPARPPKLHEPECTRGGSNTGVPSAMQPVKIANRPQVLQTIKTSNVPLLEAMIQYVTSSDPAHAPDGSTPLEGFGSIFVPTG